MREKKELPDITKLTLKSQDPNVSNFINGDASCCLVMHSLLPSYERSIDKGAIFLPEGAMTNLSQLEGDLF